MEADAEEVRGQQNSDWILARSPFLGELTFKSSDPLGSQE